MDQISFVKVRVAVVGRSVKEVAIGPCTRTQQLPVDGWMEMVMHVNFLAYFNQI